MSEKKNVDIEKALADNERIELWLSQNWKKCLILTIAVIVAAVAVFVVIYSIKENERKAIEKLSAAKTEEIAALLQKKPDSKGADFARVRLAQDLVAKKQYDKAVEQFKLIAASKSAPADLRMRARLSIAVCLEKEGKLQEAADACLLIFNDAAASMLSRNEAGFNAGRLLNALGEKSKAVEVLKKVAELPAGSSAPADEWQMQAKMMLARI